jgi:hypothetical protein
MDRDRDRDREGPREAPPQIDFATFVLSLGSSVLAYLGEMDGTDGKVERDLPLAKQSLDLLGLIQEKTKGNLDAAEEKLLGSLLYDLRIKYVDAVKKSG